MYKYRDWEESARGRSSPLEITVIIFMNSHNFWLHNLCSELLSLEQL